MECAYVSNHYAQWVDVIIVIIIIACGCHESRAQNDPCNKNTGQCNCKRRITGRTCDQCTDGSWGLNRNCKPCRCTNRGTIGGSSAACNKVYITLSLTTSYYQSCS